MAIVSIGSATNNNTSDTATVVLPAGVQANDLIEVVLHINGPKTSSDGNGATPFTELLVDRTYNGPSAQVDHYYRIATGAEPGTLTFPLSASDRWVAICTVDRGVDTASPYDVAPTSSSEATGGGATNTTNQLVTLTDGALMKSYAVNDSNSVSFGTLPSGWTTIANESGRQLIAMVSKSMATAGTQSAISYEQSTSNGTWLNNIYAIKPAASGTTYNNSVIDSIGVVDSLNRVSSYVRSENEGVGISDLISKTSSTNRSVDDALGISDVLNITKQLSRSVSDSVGLLDVVTVSTILNRSVQDSVGIIDSLENQLTITVSLGDSVGVADQISRQLLAFRNVVDDEALNDIITTVTSYNKSLVESIGLTDTVSYQLVISISLADSIGLTDTTSRTHIGIQNINDPIGMEDSTSRVASANRNISDTEGIADQITRTLSYIFSLSDTVGVTDAINRQLISIRSLVDGMGLADTNGETESTITSNDPVVQSYVGALYLGMYAPTAGEIIVTDISLSDTLSISDTITVLVGTSFGYNPDITLDSIVDIKLSVVAVDDTKGEVESIFEQKLQTKISDIKGSVGGIEDFKPSVESV